MGWVLEEEKNILKQENEEKKTPYTGQHSHSARGVCTEPRVQAANAPFAAFILVTFKEIRVGKLKIKVDLFYMEILRGWAFQCARARTQVLRMCTMFQRKEYECGR